MPSTRDYYELLGVERDADDATIKKAFRQLARRLHPDVNKEDPSAADQFREVAEAYEVLSNPESRALYDRYGHAGLSGRPLATDRMAAGGNFTDLFSMLFGEDLFGGARGGYGPAVGADAVAQTTISLHDAAFGVQTDVTVDRQVACERCDASGAEPGTHPSTCTACGGTGQVRQVMRTVLGQMIRTGTCPDCHGRGVRIDTPCRDCRGGGRLSQQQAVNVTIPAGIEHGQQIRIRGYGHAGEAGAASGDLYVAVAVTDDPRFRRDGTDLVTVVDLTMTQAALGAKRDVPTLDGDASIDFKAGTQPGEVKVLRGQGMPDVHSQRRGNLRVLVNVLVPRILNADQRKIVEELDTALDDRSYRDGDGIKGRWRRFRDSG